MQTHAAVHRVDVLLIALLRDPIGSRTNLPIENPDFLVVVALGPQDRPNLDLVPIGHDAGRPLEIEFVEPEVISHTTNRIPRSSCNITVEADRPRENPSSRKCST